MGILSDFFKNNGTTMRIAMGQSSLLITLLLVAAFFGLVPDSNRAVIEGRAALAEAVAANSSIFVTRADLRRMEANLNLVLSRNPDILSAAVRKGDDAPIVTIGDHQAHWLRDGDPNTQLVVPLWEGESRWGQVELRFKPLGPSGLLAFFYQPLTLLIGFIALTSFIGFFFYLRKMLKDLDPSQAIPDRVRSALDTMAEGLLVLDAKQNIVLANSAFSDLVGVSSSKLLGRKVDIFNWLNMEDGAMTRDDFPWTKALESCVSQRNDSVRLSIEGEPSRTFQTNCSPVLTAEDKAGGVLVSFDDITELEEKEQQLLASKLEAEHANQAKSDFLANMSHEIRTPMTSIMGFTEVLKRAYNNRSSDAVQKDSLHYLDTIANSSQHLLDLINDILDLSKVEAGQVEVESIACSAHRTIHDVMQIMQAKAHEKGISLQLQPQGPLPETIQSDPSRLRQILINLVGNAIKFTEQGEVSIITSLVDTNGKSMLKIGIKDTGIGMTPTQAEAVFSPFVQAESSITRRFGGTGLGLTICKRFAEAMGGDVTVSSEAGKGSVFTITVPTGDLTGVTMLAPQELAAPEETPADTSQAAQWIFKPARVLLVDDGASNRELLTVVLEDYGLDVTTANNGQQAVDLLEQKPFDLVLMDVQMPVMDGYAAVRTIRQRGLQLPVVALTADAMIGTEERCLAAGYSGYLTKPVDFERLLEQLVQDLDAELSQHEQKSLSSAVPLTTTSHAEDSQGALSYAIFSSLPRDHEKYRGIILRFVARLQQQIHHIEQAVDEEQYNVLQDLGHWLKGSAGSVGFHDFDEPGQELEMHAREHNKKELMQVVRKISLLGARVLAAYPGVAAEPESLAMQSKEFGGDVAGKKSDALPEVVTSAMLDNPRFRPLVVKFINSLTGRLDDLELAIEAHDLPQAADIAHWLKGSAGTLGLHEFTEPADELEQLAKAGKQHEASEKARLIRSLFERIPKIEAGAAV